MSKHLSDLPANLATVVDLLRWRALHQPEQLAYTFLVDGETAEISLTYGELDRQAQAIGALRQRSGAGRERALLLYPPGLEFIAAFFGCLYGSVVPVPVYPPSPAQLHRTLPEISSHHQRCSTAGGTDDITYPIHGQGALGAGSRVPSDALDVHR